MPIPYRQDEIQIGDEVDTLVGISPNTLYTRGTVIQLVITPYECHAITQVGNRRGITHMLRTPVVYRCKLDDQPPHANLLVCPLAKPACHSPCDILAVSYGAKVAYPNVIQIPE